MKKRIIKWITVVLVGMTIVSIGLMFVGGKSLNEIIKESFSLTVEVVALSIAVISQVDSNREERRLQKIISNLRKVVEKDQLADATRARLEDKEDQLLRGQAKISRQLQTVQEYDQAENLNKGNKVK